MTRNECIELISKLYREFAHADPRAISEETRLFGGDSPLDSTALVSLLIEVEQQVNDHCSATIVLADDRAMLQKRSPFRTFGSLADYVEQLLSEG